jgi:hypothetical protein
MAEPLGWRCEQVPIYSIGTMLELIYVRYRVSYVSATENARFLFLRTELHDAFVEDSNFVAVATNSGSKWDCDIHNPIDCSVERNCSRSCTIGDFVSSLKVGNRK